MNTYSGLYPKSVHVEARISVHNETVWVFTFDQNRCSRCPRICRYTDPSGYSAEKTVTVEKTGSRIKTRIKVEATSNSNGSATVSISGGNGAARKAVKGAVESGASTLDYSTSDTSSPSALAKSNPVENSNTSGDNLPRTFNEPGQESLTAAIGLVAPAIANPLVMGAASNGVGDEHTENIANGLEDLLGLGGVGTPIPPDDDKTNQIRQPSSALGRDLQRNGQKRPGNEFEAHHIVPLRVKEAQAAREILARYKIGLDSHVNGVWLPKNIDAASQLPRTMVPHRGSNGIHSRNADYARAVNRRLIRANDRASANKILRGIRSDLENGVEFWR